MTTRLAPAVDVAPSGLVTVCAWCVPAATLAQLHRDYRCTDGMCSACSAQLERAAA